VGGWNPFRDLEKGHTAKLRQMAWCKAGEESHDKLWLGTGHDRHLSLKISQILGLQDPGHSQVDLHRPLTSTGSLDFPSW
jgi:hypothetical protein